MPASPVEVYRPAKVQPMRTILSALLVVAVTTGSVRAQPGQTPVPDPYPPPPTDPYPPPPPPQQPYPPPPQQQLPPPGYVPAPYQYMPVQLNAEDQQLLAEGEISEGAHVGGVVANVFLGFGVGQAVQGRWSDTGWIFTLGEAASITALFVGLGQAIDDCFASDVSCNDSNSGEGLMIAGLIGYLGFRVWSIADAVSGPSKHNRKVRELKMRLGIPQPMYGQKLVPYVHKSRDGGGTAGLSFSF